jgi:hypothetical protein
MRTRLAPLMFLLSAACAPVLAVEADKDGTSEDGIDLGEGEGEGDGEDTDGDDPDEEEEVEPDPGPTTADWAGEWFAFIDLEADTEGGWGDQEIGCSGEMVVEIDDDGDATGEGACSVSGWAEAGLSFYGEVDADGNLEGTLVFDLGWGGDPADLEVWGSAADDSEILADAEGLLVLGGWGGDYEVPVFGEFALERE